MDLNCTSKRGSSRFSPETGRLLVSLAVLVVLSLGCAAGVHAGTVWSWGTNDHYQLGDGTTINHTFAQQVPGLTNVESVATGRWHSLAMTADGAVFAWGYNAFGQLGDGTTVDRPLPVQVVGLGDVVAISAGSYHSLALEADGTVWAWGDNDYGALGDGSGFSSSVPVPVANLTDIVAIASAFKHNLALRSDGTVWGWGWNNSGCVGDGSNVTRYTPVPVSGLSDATAIACGFYHSLAVTARGNLYAWGENNQGQLGDGSTVDSWVPIKARIKKVEQASAGAYHSLALKTNGTAWAWGDNAYGQLGDGTQLDSAMPVQVSMGLNILTAVSAGNSHSFCISGGYPAPPTLNNPWGWGRNPQAHVTATAYPLPVPLGPPREVTRIATQFSHSLAVVPEAMRVLSIDMSTSTKGKNTRAVAEVQVVDDQGLPLEGVWVEGRWTGLTTDTEADYTDFGGMVSFTSDSVRNASGVFTFTITRISKLGFAFDRDASVLEGSISFP